MVKEFRGLAPRWLAFGGGGYDLHAVARAWTLAYGIMSEQELPNEVPAPYRDRYDVASLRDPDEVPVSENVRKDSKVFAESSVQEVHRLIFPGYGIRSA